MPQFPSSKYSASPAAGTFVRAQGSHSPMVEADVQAPDTIKHPFQITAYKTSAGAIKARVRAGTANNLVPILDGDDMDIMPPPELTLTDNATNRIYLKAEKGASPVFFPDTLSVITSTSVQSDTNTEGYLLLGSVVTSGGKIQAVNQYVYASQVVVRAKPGSATALWSWSSR